MEIFGNNATEWSKFQHYFKRQEIAAKSMLLKEGEVSKRIFFVEKGSLRAFFNNNGEDITLQFFFERQAVSSIESFRTGQPSLYAIESIEPSIVYSVTQKDFQVIINESLAIKQLMEEVIFQRLIFYQKLFFSRIKDNPEKRYLDLLKSNPEMLRRIPQHYIASFLGITSVSLSRIKNRCK